MTISYSTIKDAVKRHLSIIGKRLYDKEGKNLFSNITVSTAEDTIFSQYIASGAQQIEATMRQMVENFVSAGGTIVLVLKNARGTLDFDSRCQEIVTSYLTYYSVGEYLAMTHPDLAEKYNRDAVQMMQSLVAYAYHKEPPITALDGVTFSNPQGKVTQ